MDEPPTPPYGTPRRPAVHRPDSGSSAVSPATGPGGPAPSRDRDDAGRRWRHLPRTARGAVGLALVAAALLLWPFSGWFWVPWLAGLVALVLVALLRLDRLLGGWTWHVGGLAVVVGLMLRTGPWDWALAGSLGVLLAGLVQLPMWRLAAVGAVLCMLAGVGWGFDRYRDAQQVAAQEASRNQQDLTLYGARTPEDVLPALLEGIGQSDVRDVCALLSPSAEVAFVQAARAADCEGAVGHFHGALPRVPPLRDLDASISGVGDNVTVDGCRTVWATPSLGGPALGVLEVVRSGPPGRTFFVTGFRACTAG